MFKSVCASDALIHDTVKFLSVSTTSHAGAVSWVHCSHRLRDSGWAAYATFVYSAHTEDIRAPLDQTSDGESGKLHRGVIALNPVSGSDLTPVRKR